MLRASHARPRAYVRVTENSFEMNQPLVTFCCDHCIYDNVTKVYFDKLAHTTPFRAKRCSPYTYTYCCCVCEPCGQTVAFAPSPQCANECCLCCCFPCFRFVPGLENADAFVDYFKFAQADFMARKMPDHAGGCGCFHKKST